MSDRTEKASAALRDAAAEYDRAAKAPLKDPERDASLSHGDTLLRIATVQAQLATAEADDRIADALEHLMDYVQDFASGAHRVHVVPEEQ